MASNQRLRRTYEVSAPPSRRALACFALLAVTLVVGGFLAVSGLATRSGGTPPTPQFLLRALGAPADGAPTPRTSPRGTTVSLDGGGYHVAAGRESVSVSSVDAGSGGWHDYARGVDRGTSFGAETIVLGANSAEQSLTVTKRQGVRTWRWTLGTHLAPRVNAHGTVGFVDRRTHRLSDIVIEPVKILDGRGRDVTPRGLRWTLGGTNARPQLELRLDDRHLPLPYVIDPIAIRATNGAAGTNGNVAAASTVSLSVPSGVALDDQLLAIVTWVQSGTAVTATPAVAGSWTQVATTQSVGTSSIAGAVFRRAAGATDGGASFTWNLSGSVVATGGIAAYIGVDNATPIHQAAGAANVNANNTTLLMPSVTTTIANTEVVGLVGALTPLANQITAPTGAAERYELNQTGTGAALLSEIHDQGPAAAGLYANNGTIATKKIDNVTFRVALKPDTTVPTIAVALGSASPAGSAFKSGNTVFYRGVQSGGGNFTLQTSVTDNESGAASATTATLGGTTTGWSHTASTVSTPAGGPYLSNTFAWTQGTSSSPTESVTGKNNATLSSTATSLTFTNDSTVPTVTAPSVTAGYATTLSVPVTVNGGSDGTGSGVAAGSSVLQRDEVALTNGTCGAFPGTWSTTVTLSAGNDTSVQDGKCYVYREQLTDNVGNVGSSAASNVVKVDSQAPSNSLSLTGVSPAGSAFKSGTTVFYRGAQTGGGSFQLSNAVSDTGGSGPASSATAALGGTTTGWTHTPGTVSTPAGGPYASAAFSWSQGTTSSPTEVVTGRDAAGNATAASALTFTNDSTAPSVTAPTVPTYATSLSIAVTANGGSDSGGSGVAAGSSVIQRDSAPLTNGSCGTFSGSWTTVTLSSGNDTTGLANGNCYEYRERLTDNVGNVGTSTASSPVELDTAGPTNALSLTGVSPAGSAFKSGTNVFYRGAAAGSFQLRNTLSDTESGPASSQTGALAGTTTGWTHTAGTVSTPAGGPYDSAAFSWSAGTASSPTETVTGRDAAGNATAAGALSFVDDVTAPTGGAVTVNGVAASSGGSGSFSSSGSFTITARNDFGETASATASGLASSVLTLETASLTGNSCGTYGSPSVVTGTPSQAGLATGCYRYVLTGTDNVGNSATVTTVVKVDTSAPSAPTLGFASVSGSAFYPGSGTRVFFRPAVGASGQFDVSGAATDADTGVASYTFPGSGAFGLNWTASGAGSTRTYSFSGAAATPGTQSVTATNLAGGTSAASSFDVVADTSTPAGGALTVNGTGATGVGSSSYSGTGSFAIARTDFAETASATESGLASSVLTRAFASYSSTDVCGGYGAPTTLVGTPAQSGLATGCYRYTLTGTDNVGNAVSISTVVKVDTSAPSQPAVSFANVTGNAFDAGSAVLFVKPDGNGSFDVTASASDADTGVASYSFPGAGALGANWAAAGSGATRTYSFSPTAATPGAQSVTARNAAGLDSTGGTFTVKADTTAPAGGALTVNGVAASAGGSTSYSATGSFPVDARTDWTEGASPTASGLASSTLARAFASYSSSDTCGSYGAPTTVTGAPAQSGLATGCYRYTLTGTDNVGNFVSGSTLVKVDTSAPSAPGLGFGGVSGAAYYPGSGTRVYFRAGAAAGGQFDLSASSADADTGVASYAFPALGSGWTTTGSGSTRTYAYASGAGEPGTKSVTAANAAGGVSAASSFDVTADAAPPTAGALAANATAATAGGTASYSTSGSFSLSRTDFAEALGPAASGLASSVLTRESGTLAGSSCSGFGAPATVTGAPAETGLATGCYRYTLTGTDNVGNVGYVTTTVKVDRSAPAAPALSLGNAAGAAYYPGSGSRVFFRPGSTGQFDVTAAASDPDSGIASYAFPTLGPGWTASGSGATRTFSFAGGAGEPGAQGVTATNGAGATSATATFDVTADSAAPSGGGVSVNGTAATAGGSSSYSASGSFAVDSRSDWAEAASAGASGLASSTLTRRFAAFSSADSCGAYGAPTTLTGTPAESGLGTGCYRYTLTGTDNVGNVVSISTTVKVDTSAPAAPSLTISNASGGAFYPGSGTTAYFRPGSGGGQLDVAASATDSDSGVASYAFPSLGSGWTASGSGAARTYSFATGAAEPGAQAVTATNNAGGTSAAASFTLRADSTAPTTVASCNGSACAPDYYVSAPVLVTLVADDGAGSGVLRIRYTTDGSDPSPVNGTDYTGAIAVGTTTTVKFRAYDNLGNEEAVSSQTVLLDGTPPTGPALTLTETPAVGAQHVAGTTLFYRPGASGTFRVAAATDDAQTGIDHVVFPSVAGVAGGGSSQTAAPFREDYSWNASTSASGSHSVTATNGAGATSSASFTLTPDSTAPTGVSLAVVGGAYATSASVTLTLGDGDDGSGSGVDASSGLLERDEAPLAGDACGSFSGSWTAVSNPDTTVQSGSCYRYRYSVADNVGNRSAAAVTANVKVDTTGPTAPTLSFGAATAAVDDGVDTVYYQPTAGSGSFTVTASGAGDPETGIGGYTFPAAAAGWTRTVSGTTATYSHTGSPTNPPEPNDVHATNGAGTAGADTSFRVTPDGGGPTGVSATVAAGYATTLSVPVTVDQGTDAGSGVAPASGVLERDEARLAAGVCNPFPGAWTAVTLTGGADASVQSGTCYRYRYRISDRLGNESVSVASATVKVDASAPATPTLSFGSFANAAASAGTVFFRPGSTGGFTVSASSTDPESGVASTSFPSLGPGWTNTGGTYSFDGTAAAPAGGQGVHARNGAGVDSAAAPLDVVADAAAPSTSIACDGGTCGTGFFTSSPVTVGLSATDAAGSGVAEIRYTTDGSDPSPVNGTTYTAAFTVSATTTVKFRAYDAVGNAEAVATQLVRIDTSAPAAPALALSASDPAESVSGSTLYYNPSGANAATFTVDATAADAESGISSVSFPALAGMTGGGADGSSPYTATYSWDAAATTSPGAASVTATNGAGLAGAAAAFTVTKDVAGPTGGSVAYADGFQTGTSVTVTTDAGTDAGAGLDAASAVLERRTTSLDHGSCASFSGGWAAVSATNTVPSGTCAQYRFRVSDLVGNQTTYTSPNVVAVDASAPAAPSLSLDETSPHEFVSGTTLYYNPSGSNSAAFTVSAVADDAESGVAHVDFPTVFGGDSATVGAAPFTTAYTWSAGAAATGGQTVTAANGAGLTATANFTVTPDTTAPAGGTFDYADGYTSSGVVALTLPDAADTGAGLDAASAVLERQTATLTGGNCGTYGAWAPVSNPDSVPSGRCAVYRYRISDRVGNEATYTSAHVVRSDSAGPSVAVTDPGSPLRGTVTLAGTAGDAASDVAQVRFERAPAGGSTWTTVGTDITSPFTADLDTTPLADGLYDLRAVATDLAGNATTSAVVSARRVDNTAPDTGFDTHPGNPSKDATPAFTFSADETGSSFECALDGGSFSSCTSPHTTAALPEGTHTLRVRATDAAGNVDPSPAAYTWTVDLTAPTVTLDSPASGARLAGTVTLSSTASDALSGPPSVVYQYAPAGGGAWTATPPAWDTVPLADGDYDVRAVATDGAGNSSTATITGVGVDNHAPTVSITAPTRYVAAADPATVSITASSGDSDVANIRFYECSDGSSACASGTWTLLGTDTTAPFSASWAVPASDGDRAISAVATDQSGNPSLRAVRTITIDRTAPSGVSVSYPGGYAAGAVTVTTSNGPDADVDAATGVLERQTAPLAGDACGSFGGWTTVTSPDTQPTATCARYRYTVADAAGNPTTATGTAVVRRDTTAPSTPTLSFSGLSSAYAAGGTVYFRQGSAGAFTVAAASSDAESGVASTLFPALGAGWSESGGTYSFDASATAPSGSQSVRARNGAGLDSAAATFDVVGDGAAPTTTASCNGGACSAGWYSASPVTVGLAASDAGGSGVDELRYTTDGSDPTAVSGTLYTAPFAVATTTTVKYRAFDRVGNSEPVATLPVRIDVTAPSVTLTAPAAGAPLRGTATLTSDVVDGGSGAAGAVYAVRPAGSPSWTTLTGASWDTTSVVDGLYDVRATGSDVAGNSAVDVHANVRVDNTAPSVTLNLPAGGADVRGTVALDSSLGDGGSGIDASATAYAVRASGGSTWTTLPGTSWNTTGYADGLYDVRVSGADNAGNQAADVHTSVRVDNTAPSASLAALPAVVHGAAVALTGTSTDGGSGIGGESFEVSPHGAGSFTTASSPWDTTALADGQYDLRVVATDRAGNSATSSPAVVTRVDNSAPALTFSSPAAGASLRRTVNLVAAATDADPSPALTFSYRTHSGPGAWQQTPAAWDTTALADGHYDLRASSTDWAGNVATQLVLDVTTDNLPPALALTAPADGSYVNAASASPVAAAATATDSVSGVASVEFFGCSTSDCTGGTETSLGVDTSAPYDASWPVPADGARAVKAVALDGSGNRSTAVSAVTVDTVLPDTAIAAKPGDPSRTASPSFTFSATDGAPSSGGLHFQCRLDGGTWAACTSPHTAAPATDGSHTFEVRALDAAGNVDGSPDSWTWHRDTSAPAASLGDPGRNVRGTVALAATLADPTADGYASGLSTAAYEYSTDGATWAAIGTRSAAPLDAINWDTTGISDGVYRLRVTATDAAGNATTSAAVTNVRVDNTAPTTSQDDPGATLRGSVNVSGSAADAGSGIDHVEFERRASGAAGWTVFATDATAPYVAALDTSAVADGHYDFRTVAYDVAGNSAPSAAVAARLVDNTAPTATMTDPGANLRGTVSLGAVTSDPGGADASGVDDAATGFEYSDDNGATWHTAAASWNTTALPDGLYDLRVHTRDVAGNPATSAPVTARRIDNTKPATSDDAPAGYQSSAVTVTLSAADAGSGVNMTEYSVDGGAFAAGTSVTIPAPANGSNDGAHTIAYFSADNAGNVETTRSTTVLIDATPPACPACTAADYLRGTVTLSAHPSESGAGIKSVAFQRSAAGSGGPWTTIGTDTTGSSGTYTASWATTGVADGHYDLRVRVTDNASNATDVDLDDKVVDNTPPNVAIVGTPTEGEVVAGTVHVAASAADVTSPVASVQFSVDGRSLGTDTSAPYELDWGTAAGADGAAHLQVVVTDLAGNSTPSSVRTVTVDNHAPAPTLADPGAAVRGTLTLSASSDPDTSEVDFQRAPAGSGSWSTFATDGSAPFSAGVDTTALTDGLYDFRVVAFDGTGHTGSSAARAGVRVDNTVPTGSLTAPAAGRRVGGSVALEATAADGGSGVDFVRFESRPTGGGAYSAVALDASAPYAATWDVRGLASGDYDLRVLVTDRAGNVHTGTAVTVHVDATAPTVTLADPGSALSGTATLAATTAGADVASVAFSYSKAGANAWQPIGTDSSAPYTAALDTTTLADGTYDLRAVVSDSVGNTSASVRTGVRVDNTAPRVLASTPGEGAVVASAASIVLTTSEEVTLVGPTVDGAPSSAPVVTGTRIELPTGSLAVGTHTLAATLRDGSGKEARFLLHFTVWTAAAGGSPGIAQNQPDPSAGGTVATPDGVARVALPPDAWSRPAGSTDWLVLGIEQLPPPSGVVNGFGPGSQVVDVTARWAAAGTLQHEFSRALDVVLTGSAAGMAPATFDAGGWRVLRRVPNAPSLPGDWLDGFYAAPDGIHILTRHLSLFALLRDLEPPAAPSGFAGDVGPGGLTLHWTAGADNSGLVAGVTVLADGVAARTLDASATSVDLGPITADDTRRFTVRESDQAGNVSADSVALRTVPSLAGKTLDEAKALLEQRGLRLGIVVDAAPDAGKPGTVTGPTAVRVVAEGSAVDVEAVPPAAPAAKLAFSVSTARTLTRGQKTIPVTLQLTRAATVTGVLYAPGGSRKLLTWRFVARAGRTTVKLRWPQGARQLGTYTIRFAAASGGESVARQVSIRLVKHLAPARARAASVAPQAQAWTLAVRDG